MTETVRTDPTARPPDANGGTPSPAPANASRSARTVRATASRWFQRPARTWPGRVSIIAGSAAIALGVSDAINRRFLAPGGMHVTSDVVGYPTLRNFDSVHYTELFALAAVVFPVILLVSFVVLDRIVPRVFARFGNERVVNGAGVAGRLAIPGAALGLAVAAAAQQTGRAAVVATMVLGAVAWAVVVGAAAFVLERLRPGESYAFRLAEANALAVPVTLLGLAAVSTATGVEVVDTDTVEHHPFLPWWLAVVGVAVVVGLVAWRLRSAGPGIEDRRAFERDTVALVAGSVIVFLITAKLPGAVGHMDAFHEGESLATATMLRDGLFPWRDLLFIHGPLHDGLVTMLGFAVFGDTRWGGIAGAGVLATPLAFVFVWILLARVLRANWAVLAGYPLLLAAGSEFFGGLALLVGGPADGVPAARGAAGDPGPAVERGRLVGGARRRAVRRLRAHARVLVPGGGAGGRRRRLRVGRRAGSALAPPLLPDPGGGRRWGGRGRRLRPVAAGERCPRRLRLLLPHVRARTTS